MNKTKYLAYGSNLNIGQMAQRCPTATVIGKGVLQNYELLFKGRQKGAVATIEPKENSQVPFVIWEIETRDENALDIYEGYPRLYRKEKLEVELNGEKVEVMVYIMNEGYDLNEPATNYLSTIVDGYVKNELDITILEQHLSNTKKALNTKN